MPVPTGTASLLDIQNEFGGSNPISLSEYYGVAGGVPSQGAISINDFRGKSVLFSYVITTNQSDVDLYTFAIAQGWDGFVPVEVTLNSGVIIWSTSTTTPALSISGSFPNGVTFTNSGTIVGDGGDGGNGGVAASLVADRVNPTSGQAGGTALAVSVTTTFNNLGTIAGGGGGGGGGGYYYRSSKSATTINGGGGGGGGRSGLTDSLGGTAGNLATDGAVGTFSAAGAGGAGQPSRGAAGGSGGGWGASGVTGVSSTVAGAAGGAGGLAVSGSNNITWLSTGTRLGGIT